MPLIKYSISPLLTKCTLEQKPGALGKVMEGGREGLWREDRMWHYSRITTDTLYSSRGLLRVLHCTAAPSVTVMPVDRGLLEVEDQTEALD